MYAEEKILRFKMICNSVYSKTEVFIKKKKNEDWENWYYKVEHFIW